MESRKPPSGSPFFAGADTVPSPEDPFRDGARFLQSFALPTRTRPTEFHQPKNTTVPEQH